MENVYQEKLAQSIEFQGLGAETQIQLMLGTKCHNKIIGFDIKFTPLIYADEREMLIIHPFENMWAVLIKEKCKTVGIWKETIHGKSRIALINIDSKFYEN